MVGIASRESHPWLKTQFLHAELVFHQIMGDNIFLSAMLSVSFSFMWIVFVVLKAHSWLNMSLLNAKGFLSKKLLWCAAPVIFFENSFLLFMITVVLDGINDV